MDPAAPTLQGQHNLQHMFLDLRRKLEYQEETPKAQGEHSKFT